MPIPVAQYRLRKYLNLSGDLGGDAVAAIREGHSLLDAGIGWLHKQVLVQSLRPYTDGDATVVPLRWVASGSMTSLVPIMDANVELRAEGSAGSRLTLRGSYRPPLGRVGAVVDQVLLHRVAQATADSFLTKLGDGLLGPAVAGESASRTENAVSADGAASAGSAVSAEDAVAAGQAGSAQEPVPGVPRWLMERRANPAGT